MASKGCKHLVETWFLAVLKKA